MLAWWPLSAQTYRDSITDWQHHYKKEFLDDPHSPIKIEDTAFLRFFPINRKWCVTATVKMTPDAQPFDMATHSGKTKKFRQWAELRFADPTSSGLKFHTLRAFERVNPPAGDTVSRLTLFIPFYDETNSGDTYGGGRYMDVPKAAVNNGRLVVDFNKAYNPYCAFAEGFSCPIPPAENKLTLAVKAGEMVWTKKAKED
jgi:uncharacterized protein (DUF1684 family)